MNLFLDSSVVLAACGSAAGASRYLFDRAESLGWNLQTSSYVLDEVDVNLQALPSSAFVEWVRLRPSLHVIPDVLSYKWAAVFAPAKDRPILFSAAAWSDVLLTLDRRDFADLLGDSFYGLPILRPGEFLQRERAASRLI